jgi:hypothetical protein
MLAPPNSVFGIFLCPTLKHNHPDCRWLNLLELSKRLIKLITAPAGWLPEPVKNDIKELFTASSS